MDLIFLLYLCAATSAYAESQNLLELDRARSAWNFGGHPSRRKLSDNGNYWLSRTRNVPGGIIADRRSSPAFNVYKTPSPMVQPIQYLKQALKPKPYGNPKHKGKKSKKGNKKRRPSKTIATKIPKHPQMVHDYFNPRRTMRYPATKPKPGGSFRLPRKINRRSDSIMERFNMDDLWHLDKGESYALKNEDIYHDQYLRGVLPEGDDEENEINDDDDHHDHQQKLQEDAEDLINHKEKNCEHFKNAGNEDDEMPHHIHHHHHYQQKNATNSTKEAAKPAKKPEINKVVPYTLPRIHNPIPLGCLLAVPVFHPIRPRHQLTCLLSIPGTPNLIRRRRSADLQQQQPAQSSLGGPAVGANQLPQYSTFPTNTYNLNERMTPPNLRKHYANHVGGEKTPSPQPPSRVGNLKVPATIIAPPKFDKADVLQMLLGSGAVNLDEMGTILMTNNRYVRIGRGLPNSSPENSRRGRSLWGPVFPSRSQPMSSSESATQNGKQQSAQFSNNLIPITQGKPFHKENGRMPLLSLTPIPPSRISPVPSSNSQGLMQNIMPTRRQPPAQHYSIVSFPFQQSSAPLPSQSQYAPFQPSSIAPMPPSPATPQQTFDVPLPQGSLAQPAPQQSMSFTQEGPQDSGKPSKIDKVLYPDWKPSSNKKPKMSKKPTEMEFSGSPLGAESKLVIKKVKAPSSVPKLSGVVEQEETAASKITLQSEYIDVSDLAEALGYMMPLELESITPDDSNVGQTLQNIETPDPGNFNSMSYAVKHEYASSADDENENALRYSLNVEDDYNDGEASTIRFTSARRGKRIPDPIIIQVPK